MNFLAHTYLSGRNDDLILGNFIADMVKGRQIESYSPGVVQGIQLHRRIDSFTDHHPVVACSKDRIRKTYRHYSGVVVDMYYDHFLAKNWAEYHHEPLDVFVRHPYSVLLRNYNIMPARARRILPYMIGGNWLVSYARLEGLQKHMEGMARRTPFDSGMEHAVNDLRKHYQDFHDDFNAFFPELMHYVAKDVVAVDR